MRTGLRRESIHLTTVIIYHNDIAISSDKWSLCCKVQRNNINIFTLNVLPDIFLRPVRNRKYTHLAVEDVMRRNPEQRREFSLSVIPAMRGILKISVRRCGLSIIYTTTGNKFKKTVHIRNNPPSFSFPYWLLRHHCQ